MALKLIQTQDWNGQYTYAPPLVDTVINLDDVVSARSCDSRGIGPWTKVRMRDGTEYTMRGNPADLLPDAE